MGRQLDPNAEELNVLTPKLVEALRERPELRDRLIPLGVTMMSAGSSTRPGGYAHLDNDAALEQFEIEDGRSPAQVAAAIRRAGYDPVWKDFDRAFVE